MTMRVFSMLMMVLYLSSQMAESLWVPPLLARGGTVGAITPGAALGKNKATYTSQVNAKFKVFGLDVSFGAHCFDRYWRYMASTDENRADDINVHLHDSRVTAIISNRGGWGCNKLYDRLDWAALVANPKIVMGYSDVTGLSNAVATRANMVAFHGAMTIDGLWKGGVNYHQITTMLQKSKEVHTLKRTFKYAFTITSGTATGVLRGGNLNVFANMIYSGVMPVEALDGAILALEETGDRPKVLDRNMLALKHAGVFRRIAGLVFGQCDKCGGKKDKPQNELDDSAWRWVDIANKYAKEAGVPAYFGLFFGHHMKAGQLFLPLGAHMTLDADKQRLTSTHPVVADTTAPEFGSAGVKALFVPDKIRVWINRAYRRAGDGMHMLRVISSVKGSVKCMYLTAPVEFSFDAVEFEFGVDANKIPQTITCNVDTTNGSSEEVSQSKDELWKTPLAIKKPKTGIVNGGTIGFISPAKWYSNVRVAAKSIIKNIDGVTGLQSSIGGQSRYNWFSGTDQQRADEFMKMVRDPSVSVMMVNSGQAGACRIIDLLDYDVIRNSDKVIMGAGSATCLINAVVSKAGLVAYYGPVSAENMSTGANYRYMSEVLAQNVPIVYDAHESWWSTIFSGKAKGPLIGGEIHSLSTIAGTEFMPIERFDGAILFLTDNNQVVYHVDRHLSKLANVGVFSRIAGVVVGTCMDGECEGRQGVEQTRPESRPWHVYDIIKQYVAKYKVVPTYTGATFGVGSGANMIFPIGAMAEIDADAGTISLMETPLGRVGGEHKLSCVERCTHMLSQSDQLEQCAHACEQPHMCQRCSRSLVNSVGCIAGCAMSAALTPSSPPCAASACSDRFSSQQCAIGCTHGVGLAVKTNCMHVDSVHRNAGAFYGCVYGQTKGM